MSLATLMNALNADPQPFPAALVHVSDRVCEFAIDTADRVAFASLSEQHHVPLEGHDRWDAAARGLDGRELIAFTNRIPGRSYAAAFAITLLGVEAALQAGSLRLGPVTITQPYPALEALCADEHRQVDIRVLPNAVTSLARKVLHCGPLTSEEKAVVGWLDEASPFGTDVPILDPVTETLTTLLADEFPADGHWSSRATTLATCGQVAWEHLPAITTARALAAQTTREDLVVETGRPGVTVPTPRTRPARAPSP